MKALSIRQPWAWAIIHAGKDIENRKWFTNFRGRFLVHAAKGMSPGEYDDAAETIHAIVGQWAVPHYHELQRGGIIGSVELTGIVAASASPWFFGPLGFVLANPEPLPFRPLPGTLGFFDPDAARSRGTRGPRPSGQTERTDVRSPSKKSYQKDLFGGDA
jgi:hypothetical protein